MYVYVYMYDNNRVKPKPFKTAPEPGKWRHTHLQHTGISMTQ